MAYPLQVEALVQQGLVWQGQQAPAYKAETNFIASGWPALDDALGGGWLQGSVNEIQLTQPFIGELALLLPLLSQTTTTTLWLNPPAMPYAPGLNFQNIRLDKQLVVTETEPKLALWAAEQALQNQAIGTVLAWSHQLSAVQVRRLQQVAAAERKLVFVFAPQQQDEARAYVTRLQLTYDNGLQVRVLKRRFGWPLPAFPCAVESRLPRRRRAS